MEKDKLCEKNDESSRAIISKIFDGIDEKALINTIRTILKMEENLRKM